MVYIKSKELISDFLAVIGVEKSLANFADFMEMRDESNQHNRVTNCYMGNLEKTLQASGRQVAAIQALRNRTEFFELSDELQQLANARLSFPMMTMQELANHLKISKSCLSHRMRKLMSVAEKYVEDKR